MAVIHFFNCIFSMKKWLQLIEIQASCDLKGPTGVLWGPSEFILDPTGLFRGVLFWRAALGTKYEGLVWALLHNTAVYAPNR